MSLKNESVQDNCVEVELEMSNDDILMLALMAHKRDITLNKLINKILRKKIENEQQTEDQQTD